MANKRKREIRKINNQLNGIMKQATKKEMDRKHFEDWTLFMSTKDTITPLVILDNCPVKYEITNCPSRTSSTQTGFLTQLYNMHNNFMNNDYPKLIWDNTLRITRTLARK